MAGDIRMPKLGLTMTEGIVAQWLVAPGQRFERGEPILVVETDKIANEIEAEETGSIGRIVVEEGATAAVGEVLAVLGEAPAAAERKTASPAATADTVRERPGPPVALSNGRVRATPLARRMAREAGIDLAALAGSGPGGRIKAIDVERRTSAAPAAPAPAAAAPSVAPAGARIERLSGTQQRAAAAIAEAKRDVPHFYLATEADAGGMLDLRARLAASGAAFRPTVTHFLLFAMARALAAQPHANRVFVGDGIAAFDTVDIGLAVNTAAGLVAPVLHDVGGLGLAALAARADELVARARENRLVVDDMKGGATSLSNAGMHDVTQMSSIIRPGHSSILGVGSVRQVFRPDAAGAPVLRSEIALVLSCDHRLFDGASGLAFLNTIKRFVENPVEALLLS